MNYTNDPKIISAHDKLVTINQALMVDLTGQVAAEGIGTRMIGGAGGQFQFSVGISMSRGGRCVVVLQSTDESGTRSNIVPSLTPCTPVTVPRMLTELIVTEYGIADLRGKTERERIEEMIFIAHPDHRAELRKEAQRLYG